MRIQLTWVGEGDNAGAGEVTVVTLVTLSLVVKVHEVGRVGPDCVRVEARPAFPNGPAVNSVVAHVVNVGLQRRVAGLGFWHAPLFSGHRYRRRLHNTTT